MRELPRFSTGELDRIIAGEESIWYDQKKAGITIGQLFQPLPKEKPQQQSMLTRYGFAALARRGLAAHRQHVRLWLTLPDLEEELGVVQASQHDPRTAAYWTTGMLKRDSARLTHRIKTLYGFFTLLRFIEDPAKRKQTEKSLLYLMA